jgi:hypothetical protein
MAEERYDPSTGQQLSVTGEDRSGAQVRSRLAAAAAGTTAGKGLGARGSSGAGMPKQKEGESASDYGERLRKWREDSAQKSAIRSMP